MFKIYSDKDGEIAAFKAGAIDLAFDLTQADYSAIQSTDPSVGTAELQPAWQYEHLDLNNDPNKTRGNGLWMPEVRKAIAMAINKNDLIAAVFPGANVAPACSPAAPGLWYAKAEICPAFDDAGARHADSSATSLSLRRAGHDSLIVSGPGRGRRRAVGGA